jgi:hypothetical protein
MIKDPKPEALFAFPPSLLRLTVRGEESSPRAVKRKIQLPLQAQSESLLKAETE